MRNPAITSEGPAKARDRPQFGRPTSRLIPHVRATGAARCRRKFLRIFPGGFSDETYLAWERDYKWDAHEDWNELLDRTTYRGLLRDEDSAEIAARAVKVEARTHLIFSFEKVAPRDAVRPPSGAKAFAQGLYDFTYGAGDVERKFDRRCDVVARLPRGTRLCGVRTRTCHSAYSSDP